MYTNGGTLGKFGLYIEETRKNGLCSLEQGLV